MSAWTRLRELGREVDNDVSDLLDKCLSRDFGDVVLARPFASRIVGLDGLRALLEPHKGSLAFHLIRVPDTGATELDAALAWVEAPRISAMPDTLAIEGPETLDGLPFVEVIGLKQIDVQHEVDALSTAAAKWTSEASPELYLIVPEAMILHPRRGSIQMLESTNVTSPGD
jgi:hypothetical protein